MDRWFLIISGIVILSVFAVFIGQVYQRAKLKKLEISLIRSASKSKTNTIDFGSFSELPLPVSRYFKHVLVDGQKLIKTVRMRQSGILRASPMNHHWSQFTASQLVVPSSNSFIWDANIKMPLSTHIQVIDSYVSGRGSGQVSLFSAFPVISESGSVELHSGTLLRYLAESVWFPTNLLPQSGVIWSPLNDHSAIAKITDKGITVSLEFRFNETGEVTGIYSSGRFSKIDGGYIQLPWEGHFSEYQRQSGMLIPMYGEVGWYIDGTLQLVWKGKLLDVDYDLEA